jgi:2-keto-3-deoxy-galactonokinase
VSALAVSFGGTTTLRYTVIDEDGTAPMKVEVIEKKDSRTGLSYYVDNNGNEYVVEPNGTVIRYRLDQHGNRKWGADSKGNSFNVK